MKLPRVPGSASAVLRAALLVVLAGLSGCEGLQGARIRDDNSPAAAVRATFRPEVLRHARGEGGIEVGHEAYRGEGTQSLSAGQSVHVGSRHIDGPDTLRNEVKVQQLHLAYAHRFSFGSHFKLEPRLGVARQGMEFHVEPAVSLERPETRRWTTRFFYGVTPTWRFNDWLALEARVTGSNGGALRSYGFDAGVLLSPGPSVSLRLGYSDRRLSGYVPDSLSEIDVRTRGPSGALVFDF